MKSEIANKINTIVKKHQKATGEQIREIWYRREKKIGFNSKVITKISIRK